jgi:hypothetical protein
MTIITITKKETLEFSAFLTENRIKEWFMAKDHGAYVGAYYEGKTWLKYFKGCNPEKDSDFYETARHKFGGDDFGIHISSDHVHAAANLCGYLKVKVTPKSIIVRRFR